MENDLIRRSDAENIFRRARRAMKPENYSGQEFFIRDNILLNAEQIVHSIPAVDAVEVVHSEWLFEEYPDGYYHSNCMACDFQAPEEAYLTQWRFCPNCGAKMDGEDGDKDV